MPLSPTRLGLVNPAKVEVCQATAVVLPSRLWKEGQKLGVAVGAAFALSRSTVDPPMFL